MPTRVLTHLELLTEFDQLIARLSRWAEGDSLWQPLGHCRALICRLLERVEQLQSRLESPLIVATFGGTGTGKSTLVNALVGHNCTAVGRQRPTTTRPVLIAGPQADLDDLGFSTDDFEIVQSEAPLLREIVLIDCPDPDTTEQETADSNLQRLHRLLPHCDVLIYTSTQQKYRSARVLEELGHAAIGCRLLFVQTRADLDNDIRDDWQRQLAAQYDIPEMFFVDSVRALDEQDRGEHPAGDFGRLRNLISSHHGGLQRLNIRWLNLLDLIDSAVQNCRGMLAEQRPAVRELEAALVEQRDKLTRAMAQTLRRELLLSRDLWERRLVSAVAQRWGFSPFASLLRVFNGLGNLIASLTLFRARSSAQMALIGALQGARWLKSRQTTAAAEDRLEQLSTCGLDDNLLRESRVVISGYTRSAELDPELIESASLEALRHEAVQMEDRFLGDARRRIDGIIDDLTERNSRWGTRAVCELLLAIYVGFVLFRVGRNFFYDSFLHGAPLLSVEFYISAGLFFLLWTGLLVMLFTRRLRRGLVRQIDTLAIELAEHRLARGLFPRIEKTCRQIEQNIDRLDRFAADIADLRSQTSPAATLGSFRSATASADIAG